MHFDIDNEWSAEVTEFNAKTGEVTEPSPEHIPRIKEILAEEVKKHLPVIRIMKCEMCSQEVDCRPYGPKGEDICLRCCAKNPMSAYAAIRAEKGPEEAEEFMVFLKKNINNPANYQPETDLSKMN